METYGRVANWNLPEFALLHEFTDVTGDSLDIRSNRGGLAIVDDLVSREKGQGVVVLGEHLDGSKDALEVDSIVGDLRI